VYVLKIYIFFLIKLMLLIKNYIFLLTINSLANLKSTFSAKIELIALRILVIFNITSTQRALSISIQLNTHKRDLNRHSAID